MFVKKEGGNRRQKDGRRSIGMCLETNWIGTRELTGSHMDKQLRS